MFNNLDSPMHSQNGSHQSQPVAPCVYHQGQNVTNFCKLQGCLMPLCPKCIPQHLEKHKSQGQHAELQTVDEVHEETLELVRTQLGYLNRAIQQVNNFKDAKSDAHGQLHDAVSHARQKMQRVIDAFFDQLISDLEQVTKNDKTGLDNEIQQIERSLMDKIQELQGIEHKLRTSKFLKQIINLQTSNFIGQLQQQTTESEAFIEEVSKRTLDILVDENKLYNINLDLSKYICIKNAHHYMSNNAQNTKLMDQQQQHPYLNRSSVVQQNKQPESRFNTSYSNIKQNNNSNLFQINQPDYFESLCQYKYLHYFTDRSIMLLNLDQLPLKWIELKLNTPLPTKFSTVRSPQGEIYIIGGLLNNQLSNAILKLDYKNATLQPIDQLSQARHSSVSVLMNSKLYVVGGQNLNEDLNTIEQIDFTLSKSKQYQQRPALSKMQLGGIGLSICTFKQYIIKVAPMEIFDTRTLKWSISNLVIQKGVGMVQINNQNILIFGSNQFAQLKLVDAQTAQFTLDPLPNDPKIQQIHNGSIIHQGKIFAITNRSLAIGTTEGWTIL